MGGVSKEREISLLTGQAISDALKRLGYDVLDIVCGLDDIARKLSDAKPDVVVVALHGNFGEDGCVQGMLEILRIPYTGGGVLASSVGMDKVVCNRVASQMGILCPEEEVLDATRVDIASFIKRMKIDLPVIVKPSREGSTINMTIVRDASELMGALKKAAESDTKIIVERYIQGREVTVGLINGRALTPLEIAPKSGFYDYTSKYTKGMTEYILPARIADAVASRITKWSEALSRELECEGTARADFMVTDLGEAYFLEINTIPGMTELSLVPKAAAFEGMSFDELCEELLNGARLKISV